MNANDKTLNLTVFILCKKKKQIEEVESDSSQLILKCVANIVFVFLFNFLLSTKHADLTGQEC